MIRCSLQERLTGWMLIGSPPETKVPLSPLSQTAFHLARLPCQPALDRLYSSLLLSSPLAALRKRLIQNPDRELGHPSAEDDRRRIAADCCCV